MTRSPVSRSEKRPDRRRAGRDGAPGRSRDLRHGLPRGPRRAVCARWGGGRGATALLIAAIAIGSGAARVSGRPGEPQSLAGTTLRAVEDGDALIGGLLEQLLGGGREPRDASRAIERVVVVEDAANRLVVSVTYSGLANLRLAGEVRGRDRRRHPSIVAQQVTLTDAAGDATIAFELQPGVPEGARIESASLRLVAFDPARSSVPVVSRVYALPKQWNATSNVVVTVAPRAMGTAAKLGSRPDYAAPPKVLVPMGVAVLSPAAVAAAPPVASPRPVVRDHRTGAGAWRAERPAPPPRETVRDHRTPERAEVAVKAKPAADKLGPNSKMVMIDSFRYGVRPEDVQKGAQGPAATAIELLEGLRTEDIDLDPADLLSIATSIHADKNPNSGIFYYHPRSYHLEWTPESGHGMRILYGAATGAGAGGEVLMAARLKSGLDLSEVQLATELLNAYKRRNPSVVFNALRPLPLEKNGTDVSFGSVLGQYSIPKEKIAITALSDVLGEIEVSWVTDPVTKENLQLALVEDIGVSGEVSFTSTGGALAPQVPIAIQLADRDSFGRLRWNRDEGPRNLTPYPLRLRYLHALCIDPRTNLPILYTWSLENAAVPPMARVRWDAARVPAWIDTEAKRIWVDYDVSQNCDTCDKAVLDGITGGVTSVTAEQITFHTISPLADIGGYELSAHVRSKFFDPKDRTVLEKTLVLKADNQDFTLQPIYSAGRRDGERLFEYRLDLAMPDGTVHKGTRWIASDGLRVLVGRAQVEQSLGTLPAR